jgi:hypothetical protein
VFKIALVLKSSLCSNFCVAKRQTLYGKPVITQKFVLNITQICVGASENFPTQAQLQHKSDFEHKNIVCGRKYNETTVERLRFSKK